MHESHALVEILRVHSSSPLLQGLSEGELQPLADAGRVQTVPAGAHFYRQGEPAQLLFLLTQGKVIDYRVTLGGRRWVVDAVGPGGSMGWNSVVGDAYFSTAQALEESTAIIWETGPLIRLIEGHPRLGTNTLCLAVTRIFELADICDKFATGSAEQRLASALLQLSRKLGERTLRSIRITGFSQEEVAGMAGLSLFTANRILSKWRRQRIIRGRHREIVILGQAQLESISGKRLEEQQPQGSRPHQTER